MKFCLLAPICILIASAVQAAPAKTQVAFIAGYTGTDVNTATELDRGVQAFFKAYPEAKSRLEVQRFDTKGSILETIRLMKEIHTKKISLVVGIARSDEALAAAKISSEENMLFITPFATNASIGAQGNHSFQICFSDELQGKLLARFTVQDLKAKKVMVLVNSESSYSTGLAKFYQDEFRRLLPGTTLREMTYTERELGVEAIAANAAEFRPEIVFIPDHMMRAALITKQIQKQNPNLKFLGGDGFGGRKVLVAVYGDMPDIELLYTTHWHESLRTPINSLFMRSYRRIAPDAEPTSGAAMSFDAFKILYESLEKTNFNSAPEKVAAAMRSVPFEVTTGFIKMPAAGHTGAQKSAIVMQLKKGEYRVFKTLDP